MFQNQEKKKKKNVKQKEKVKNERQNEGELGKRNGWEEKGMMLNNRRKGRHIVEAKKLEFEKKN